MSDGVVSDDFSSFALVAFEVFTVEIFEVGIVLHGFGRGVHEGPLEKGVALLGIASAFLGAGGVGAARYDSTIAAVFACIREAGDFTGFQEDRQGEDEADTGNGVEMLEVLSEVLLRFLFQECFQLSDLRAKKGDALQALFGDEFQMGVIADFVCIADSVFLDLFKRMLPAALAVEEMAQSAIFLGPVRYGHPAFAQNIAQATPILGRNVGRRNEVALQQAGKRLGVTLVGFHFGVRDGMQAQGVGKLDVVVVLLQAIDQPVPVERALGHQLDIVVDSTGLQGLQQGIGIAIDGFLKKHVFRLVDDADLGFPGTQINAAILHVNLLE